jgi:hypothetical protein
MKVKTPAPEQGSIEGEPEDEIPPNLPWVPPLQSTEEVNFQQAGERMRALVAKGIGLRAIVVEAGAKSIIDPKNWGIVHWVDPFKDFPLEIRWADGPRSRSKGEGLIVVHACMTAADAYEWIKANARVQS